MDPIIGQIILWAGTQYVSLGYLACDGRLLNIQEYAALYSLIGITYGGDGKTTFGLPDLRGRVPVGVGIGVTVDATGKNQPLSQITIGEKLGQETVTLTVAQLAAHTHAATFNPGGTNPVSVNIPVSANTAGNKLTPDSDFSYIAGTPAGSGAANMWSNTLTNPINVKGVTTSVGGTGTVTITSTGTNAPVPTIPPQLGLQYCIAVTGTYPNRP